MPPPLATGAYLRRGPGGRLALDSDAIRRAKRVGGKYVLLTNDDTLMPEDVVFGHRAMATRVGGASGKA